jgi:hypothetical protein
MPAKSPEELSSVQKLPGMYLVLSWTDRPVAAKATKIAPAGLQRSMLLHRLVAMPGMNP